MSYFPLNDLPLEMLHSVFTQMDLPTICRSCLTVKTWYRLFGDLRYRRMAVKRWPDKLPSQNQTWRELYMIEATKALAKGIQIYAPPTLELADDCAGVEISYRFHFLCVDDMLNLADEQMLSETLNPLVLGYSTSPVPWIALAEPSDEIFAGRMKRWNNTHPLFPSYRLYKDLLEAVLHPVAYDRFSLEEDGNDNEDNDPSSDTTTAASRFYTEWDEEDETDDEEEQSCEKKMTTTTTTEIIGSAPRYYFRDILSGEALAVIHGNRMGSIQVTQRQQALH